MKLYGALASPYVARVVMYADLKGIVLPLESPPGGMGSAEYKRINPTGKIPALEIGGVCIAESTVICEYLESLYPDTPLLPVEPLLQARTRMVAHMTDLYVAPHNTPLTRMRRSGVRDEELIATQAAAFATGYSYIAAYMGPGPFAAGVTPTLGDCALASFVALHKQTIFPNFPEVADPTEGNGRLATWWQALQAHPTCKRNVDAYTTELAAFLERLNAMLAARGQ